MKNNHDALPNSSLTPFRADATILVDDLSKAADMIMRPIMPKPKEFESTAEHILAPRYYGMGGLMDTSAAEGPLLR